MRQPAPYLAALLLAGVLGATPARAQTTVSLGAGLGLLMTASNPLGEGSLGIALEALAEHRVNESLSFNLRLDWGLTQFQRTLDAIRFGNSAVSWTLGAYGDITDWVGEGDPEYLLLRILGAFFAYAFVTLGFSVAIASYVVSPFLATSFLELGLSAAGHIPLGPASEVFIEGGFGAVAYVASSGVVPGVGPLLGAGVRHENLRFGVQFVWSPPILQLTSRRDTEVLVGGMTLSAVY